MGEGRQQGIADALSFAGQSRQFFAGGQCQAFERTGNQQGKGFQQTLLFRDHQLTQVSRLHYQQPVGFVSAFQRQDLIRHAGEGIGAGTCRLSFIKTPLGNGVIPRRHALLLRQRCQLSVLIRQ